MFAQAAACIRSEHQRLTELDSVGGDGDHGTTMLRAAEQMELWSDVSGTESLPGLLKAAGWRVLSVDGGASSSLLGTFLAGMGDVALAGDSMDCRDLAQAFEAGLRAISRQTKAKPGDKTMMDALTPAVAAVECSCPGRQDHTGGLGGCSPRRPVRSRVNQGFSCPLWARQIFGRENAGSSGCGRDFDRPALQGIQGRS